MAALPLVFFPVVTLLAASLAIASYRERPKLALAYAAVAIAAALLIANEALAYKLHSAIRIDLLISLPMMSFAGIVLGVIGIRRLREGTRAIATTLALCSAATAAVYGVSFIRVTVDAAKQTQQYFTGNRLYWEETIRCQGAIVNRFGTLEREEDPCTGNLRVTSRTGTYPFTRVIVTDRRDIFLMFSPENGVETVYGTEDSWPLHGLDNSEGISARGGATSGGLSIDMRRRSESCEAAIVQEAGSRTVLQLTREYLRACPIEQKAVQFAGTWSTTQPLGPQHMRLVQVWLWTAANSAWAMLAESDGVRGQERRFNFVKRFTGNSINDRLYELHPYSKLDGTGSLTLTLRDGAAYVELSEPRRLHLLDQRGPLTHPKIRLAPVYDADRFAAYFDSVLRLVDIPWTPPSSP